MKTHVAHLYKYIGNAPRLRGIRDWFIVRVEHDEFTRMGKAPFPQTFTGVVVASRNRYRPIGDVSHRFCSPVTDIIECGWPSFVKIETITGESEAVIEAKIEDFLTKNKIS